MEFLGFRNIFKNINLKESRDLCVTDSLIPNDKLIISYYRFYDKYIVYCKVDHLGVTMFNFEKAFNIGEDLNVSHNHAVLGFASISEMEEFYNSESYSKFSEKIFVNVLSQPYVYLTHSGIYVKGEDLRTPNEKVNDDVFYILYSNHCLNKTLFITNKFLFKSIGFTDKSYKSENPDKWSMSLVDFGLLNNNRMSVLVYPLCDNIGYDSITDRITSNPKELYLDLFLYSKKNNLFLSHCGNLGIQLALK